MAGLIPTSHCATERRQTRRGQDGAYIGPMIWAMAIIGTLSYMMMDGMNGMTASSGGDKVRLHASTLQNQGSFFKLATDRLFGYGRMIPTAAQMSTPGSYPNVMDVSPNCNINTADDTSADDSCFFSSLGGGISVQTPPQNAVANGVTAWTFFLAPLADLGTPADEMIVAIGVRQDVCSEINKILFNDPDIPEAASVLFNATFDPGTNTRTMGCIYKNQDFVYYQTLSIN